MEGIFSAFGVEWKLLLVQTVNFAIAFFVLKFFAYKPLLKIIDERRDTLLKGVSDASLAKENLDKSEIVAIEIKDTAKSEARTIIDNSKSEAIKLKEKILAETEIEKTRIISEASKRTKRMEEDAVLGAKESISKMAILGAEKILREKLNEQA